MRKPLYRGRRLDTNELIYGYLFVIEDSEDKDTFIKDRSKTFISFDTFTKFVEVKTETVGQWTGRIDRNKVNIFEGDFVKAGNDIMLVQWHNNFASFVISKKGWAFSHFFGEGLDPNDCEVIGNVFDNPELLQD